MSGRRCITTTLRLSSRRCTALRLLRSCPATGLLEGHCAHGRGLTCSTIEVLGLIPIVLLLLEIVPFIPLVLFDI